MARGMKSRRSCWWMRVGGRRCSAAVWANANRCRILGKWRSSRIFSYGIFPIIGARYLAVGDATGFVDPIFSAGVFIAMRSAELAAEAILHAFRRQDFSARHWRPYAARIDRGVAPFLALVKRFY